MLFVSKPFTPQATAYGVVVGIGSYGAHGDMEIITVEYSVDGVKYSHDIERVPFKQMGEKVKIRYEIDNPEEINSQFWYILGWILFSGSIVLSFFTIRKAIKGKTDH